MNVDIPADAPVDIQKIAPASRIVREISGARDVVRRRSQYRESRAVFLHTRKQL